MVEISQNFVAFSEYMNSNKGQIKPKAVWARHRFSQKMNEEICFVCREKKKSKQNKFVCDGPRIDGFFVKTMLDVFLHGLRCRWSGFEDGLMWIWLGFGRISSTSGPSRGSRFLSF